MMIKAAAVYASRHPTPLQPTDDDAFDPSRTTELHGQVAWAHQRAAGRPWQARERVSRKRVIIT
jgi:hypothetical protein